MCRRHREDGATAPRPVTALTPSQQWRNNRVRVMAALARDPYRSSRAIAGVTRSCHPAVRRARLELEAAGVIPVFRGKSVAGTSAGAASSGA